nr:integrase, catalytic region, zinc finger, CCHC-type, peptidase aspartic, catalytic [Tanacetum cinerariifolium]
MNANIINWSCLAYQEFHKSIKDEIAPIVNQVGARVQNFENHFVKEAAKFVRDFKSLAKEADESLDKFTVLENENEHLLRAIVSQDIMCNVLLLLKHPISKLSLNIRKKGDDACTSNPQEPTSKWFQNSTSFLGRLSKFFMCVDLGCSKHMTENLKLLINFVWKFLGTVRFGNDHVAAIMGYDDL